MLKGDHERETTDNHSPMYFKGQKYLGDPEGANSKSIMGIKKQTIHKEPCRGELRSYSFQGSVRGKAP